MVWPTASADESQRNRGHGDGEDSRIQQMRGRQHETIRPTSVTPDLRGAIIAASIFMEQYPLPDFRQQVRRGCLDGTRQLLL